MRSSLRLSPLPFAFLAGASLAACGSSTPTSEPVAHVDSGTPPFNVGDGGTPHPHQDGAQASTGADAARDTATPTVDTGAQMAMRNSECTPTSEETGTAVDTSYGRLDGTLVYVVDVGQGEQCNGDDSHVHLQVLVSGSVYDVAIDIGTAPDDEVGMYEASITVPGGAWAEGWHGSDALAYPSLGLHDTTFPLTAPDTIAAQVESLLTTTTKISLFCKGYSQGDGCHDVHYENGRTDGAIILNPTEATSSALFFRFSTQSF